MEDLLSVLFLMGSIFLVVSAKKYEKKILYLLGAILFIAFLGVALHDCAVGFAEGLIEPR